ncbi:MAG TPA: YggS family pyridoxal phosphate-dependent enzyme [Rhodanobacteraceae bacterium]|nr:YggS family pyridoxal phosphate-dependent enzyme [Rhodanobacteraceae bacterium]
MNSLEPVYSLLRRRIEAAATAAGKSDGVRLLAAGKGQPARSIRALAALGQRAFGENYVQEALAKQDELAGLEIEWHFIGPLQSNKCRDVARRFDWLQSLDRPKLVEALSRFRPPDRAPLNVLVEVNIDDEAGKSGCAPERVPTLAGRIAAAPGLRLRGVMAIPKPAADPARRRASFRRVHEIFIALGRSHPGVDTLSLGMSDDFELAIAEGATMVRIGSALFGERKKLPNPGVGPFRGNASS